VPLKAIRGNIVKIIPLFPIRKIDKIKALKKKKISPPTPPPILVPYIARGYRHSLTFWQRDWVAKNAQRNGIYPKILAEKSVMAIKSFKQFRLEINTEVKNGSERINADDF
jgi:hypothetical protein